MLKSAEVGRRPLGGLVRYQDIKDEAMRTIRRCDTADVEDCVVLCAVYIPDCLRRLNISATTPHAELCDYLPQPFMNAMATVGRNNFRKVERPALTPPLESLYSRFARACKEIDGTSLAARLGEAAACALVDDELRHRGAPPRAPQAWPAGAVLMACFHSLASPVEWDELEALVGKFLQCLQGAEQLRVSQRQVD
jgi:hypothetical protein